MMKSEDRNKDTKRLGVFKKLAGSSGMKGLKGKKLSPAASEGWLQQRQKQMDQMRTARPRDDYSESARTSSSSKSLVSRNEVQISGVTKAILPEVEALLQAIGMEELKFNLLEREILIVKFSTEQ